MDKEYRYLKEIEEESYNADYIGPFHKFMIPWLFKQYSINKGAWIIDIGAGFGHCLIPLHQAGYKRLVAIDICDLNFHLFKDKFGFSCYKLDINSDPLPFNNSSVAAVINFFVLAHLKSADNFLREAYRVLLPKGVLFIVTPDWRKQYKVFWRDPTHLRPYDKISIFRLLRMYNFKPEIYSWGTIFGLGRLQIYRVLPKLGLIGNSILAVGHKLG